MNDTTFYPKEMVIEFGHHLLARHLTLCTSGYVRGIGIIDLQTGETVPVFMGLGFEMTTEREKHAKVLIANIFAEWLASQGRN